jgi:ornithine cyclodeaminase
VNARTLCIVGTGRQAETQVLAVSLARPFAEIRIVGRRPEAAAALAAKLADRVAAPLVPLADTRAAVEGADVVVLATTSERPPIDPQWIAPHAYVATLGPKAKQGHELPLELARCARIIATDSPQQIARMGDTHMLHGTPDYDRIEHLGLLAARETAAAEGPALFLSIGLAGTEVACLAAALGATG